MKNLIIGLDRDGLLIYDDKYHLGSTDDWKKKVRFLPGVVVGLKKLKKKFPKVKLYMLTNNPGVAIKDFPLLNVERAKKVNLEVLKKLREKGVVLDNYMFCPYADKSYVKTHKEFKFDKKFVKGASCIKPGVKMIKDSFKDSKLDSKDIKFYYLGDRESDVKVALKSKGFGILVPFINRPGEKAKVKKIKGKNKYIAKGFVDGINKIINLEE